MSKVETIVHADHVVPGDAIMRMRRMFWRRSSQPVDQMISRVTASLPLFFKFSEVTTRRQNHFHLFLLPQSVFRNLNGELDTAPPISFGTLHRAGTPIVDSLSLLGGRLRRETGPVGHRQACLTVALISLRGLHSMETWQVLTLVATCSASVNRLEPRP